MSRESVQRGKKKLLYSIENQIAYRLKKRRRKKSKAHTLKKKKKGYLLFVDKTSFR